MRFSPGRAIVTEPRKTLQDDTPLDPLSIGLQFVLYNPTPV